MNCPNCGTIMTKKEHKFCDNCGYRIPKKKDNLLLILFLIALNFFYIEFTMDIYLSETNGVGTGIFVSFLFTPVLWYSLYVLFDKGSQKIGLFLSTILWLILIIVGTIKPFYNYILVNGIIWDTLKLCYILYFVVALPVYIFFIVFNFVYRYDKQERLKMLKNIIFLIPLWIGAFIFLQI